MKAKIFTLMIALITGIGFSANAQNFGTGVPWGTNGLGGSPLVLNEDFSGFPFFHTDENPGQGNSENSLDGETVIYGYKDTTSEVPILGSASGKISYTFRQCAFAPEWTVSAVPETGGSQTLNVSNGFVEISRFDTVYSEVPTAEGYFIVDLRQLEFVEGIQWTHSSTGGNKRGVMCEISFDDGTTWDTLRYQPAGNLWGYSFTKDFSMGDPAPKTYNTFNCQPSANGMTWEELILAENVMLRFIDARPLEGLSGTIQTARIHDLKVYADLPTSANIIEQDELKIYTANKTIHISEQAKVAVYNISGALVRQANFTNTVSMNDMPNGIYLVKAQTEKLIRTAKVIVH
ncbi:T9SS type A sorting domain-containing protein [Maribellus sediminis]|uniref:T9SS type A sorting domain-containing protein n=1 Tax=Maribellus sediminis TaxID=2696285 RepID=UPI0014322AEB|nr:T9SS type A sorting domain-containing protein [Maribellus sediminis]